jgi:hypothetical protein
VKGGGIYNGSGTVTLSASTLADNTTGPGLIAARAYGGGIYNDSGTLTVSTSTLTGNSVGVNATGGGIYNQTGTVTVSGSTLVRNVTGLNDSGGGIGGGLGVVIVDHSTISENTGGGIHNLSVLQVTESTVADNVGGPGISNWNFLIERSTISGNFNPTGIAGGIESNAFPSIGVIDNSTIADNTALIGAGVFLGAAGERLTITQSTIVGNHATGTRGTLVGGGGIHIGGTADFGSLFIGHSIVAGNDTADPFTGADVDGPVVSMGSNFVGDGDFSSGWNTTSPDERLRDHLGTSANPLDPLLGPLQDNGGPTLTRAPLPGSPLLFLDAAFGRDQRGSFRSFFSAPGAVAVNPATAFRVDAPAVVAPGQPFQVTVTPLDQWGNTASTYQGTVHFSSTDLDAQLPDDYTFVSDDAGSHTFTLTLTTPGHQEIAVDDPASPLAPHGAASLDVGASSAAAERLAAFWELLTLDTDATRVSPRRK